ncbi:hypothetical protein QR680_011963 [Steinernema hermaphroditum]|uniref:Uncharacterized protein n=1 Tax=Steinernema hermaphroditum TaxID=289476 RepID=A0AA39I0D2_9BILA|nr:hypothetical protein QR680_011963 [Steinernema hermaphroditum]
MVGRGSLYALQIVLFLLTANAQMNSASFQENSVQHDIGDFNLLGSLAVMDKADTTSRPYENCSSGFVEHIDLCLYMMDVHTLQFMDNSRCKGSYRDYYRTLVYRSPHGESSGSGVWIVPRNENTSHAHDVFYIAYVCRYCRACPIMDLHIESEMLKVYMLTRFINCAPVDLSKDQFSCYTGVVNETDDTYMRQMKQANCKTIDGTYAPIEPGLDACAFHFDANREMVIDRPSVKLYRRRTQGEHIYPRQFCKFGFHQGGSSVGDEFGIGDGKCLKRVSFHAYDVTCCFYGTDLKINEQLAKALGVGSSSKKQLCAVFNKHWVTVNASGGSVSNHRVFEEHVNWMVDHKKVSFLNSDFSEVCTTSVDYTFSGSVTSISQTATASKADCAASDQMECRTIYNKTQSYVCPFKGEQEFRKLKDKMSAECCCRGEFCNHMVKAKDFFGMNFDTDVPNVQPHCTRPAVEHPFSQIVHAWQHSSEAFNMADVHQYPATPSVCIRTLDLTTRTEIAAIDGGNVFWTHDKYVRYSVLDGYLCTLADIRFTVDIYDFISICHYNDKNHYMKYYVHAVPWTVLMCSCIGKGNRCDDKMNLLQLYNAYDNYISCYEYKENDTTVRVSERQNKTNRISLRCYLKLRESVDDGLMIEAGPYVYNRALALAQDFDANCTGSDTRCYYNPRLNSSMCCCLDHLCNGPNLWGQLVKYHTTKTLLEYEPEEIKCIDDADLADVCDPDDRLFPAIGCYMQRSIHRLGFDNKGCLYRGSSLSDESNMCEHELLTNPGKVRFCVWDARDENVFCCCRYQEDCEDLRKTYEFMDLKFKASDD